MTPLLGSALALLPGETLTEAVPAQASSMITTGTEGLDAGDTTITTDSDTIPGYWARPDDSKKRPIVLVAMEIFGLHAYIRDVCRRLAQAGYVAVAPDLLIRQGDVTAFTEIEPIRKIAYAVPDTQAQADLDASVRWVVENGNGDASRLGITGFCWGGRAVWLYSAHNPDLKAGVAWYGRLAGESTLQMPRWPLEVAGASNAPVLGLYGEKDAGIPLNNVDRMNALLKNAGSPSHIIVYPNAEHGFHADYRTSYQHKAATEGWAQMLSWFRENGVG